MRLPPRCLISGVGGTLVLVGMGFVVGVGLGHSVGISAAVAVGGDAGVGRDEGVVVFEAVEGALDAAHRHHAGERQQQ